MGTDSPRDEPAAASGEGGDPTDALAVRARHGDTGVFAPLYARLAPGLTVWARLALPAALRGRIEPDDVVQEVWVRAVARPEAIPAEPGTFRRWIYGVAKNVLLEATRRALRPDAGRGGSEAGALAGIPEEITSLSRRLARDEMVESVSHRLAALDDEDRALVLHCGFEGLPIAGAARRLGISAEAAKKRWQRLRHRLEDEGLAAEILGLGAV